MPEPITMKSNSLAICVGEIETDRDDATTGNGGLVELVVGVASMLYVCCNVWPIFWKEYQMPQARINDITVEYRFDGAETGPVILLSNSLASNYAMWDAQMPALVDAGFRVLRYDSRGHGGSSVPPGPYTLELLVADAVALLDHLELGEVCMMGCSKGGMIGQPRYRGSS